MQVVLDTNILVSSGLSPQGKPAQCVSRVLAGSDTIFYDDRIFAEYDEVLHRWKLNLNRDVISAILDYIKIAGVRVIAPPLDVPFVDESDKKFYEVAKYCNAVLITGNKKHYPDDPLVKTVQEL